MKKILIDTNVLLDVVLQRSPFMQYAVQIWRDCENRKIKGFISAISLNNMYYITTKHTGKNKALEAVRICMNIFSVISLDEKILHLALEYPYNDFEDAIQLFSAIKTKAKCIITRDAKHFPSGYLPILSPQEYLDL